jgi:hypothetical protein
VETLRRLLAAAHDGRIQVPEFQREFVLADEWIKGLLASVSLSYPIGAVMLLRAGNPQVRFEASPVAGSLSSSTPPEWFLLDGQQRMTALYQVLASGRAVPARDDRGESIRQWYYVDIEAALDPDVDRDEAIVSVPERQAPSTVESEWESCLFPLRLVFGARAELRRWQRGFSGRGDAPGAESRGKVMGRFEAEVRTAFDTYLVPTILLGKETARWSVRVHGGPEGRRLSDRFRVPPPASVQHAVGDVGDEVVAGGGDRFEGDVADAVEQPLPGAEDHRRDVQP